MKENEHLLTDRACLATASDATRRPLGVAATSARDGSGLIADPTPQESGQPVLPSFPDPSTLSSPKKRRGTWNVASPRVKLGISIVWYSGVLILRELARVAGQTPRAQFIVLYYHDVPDDARVCFARQMHSLSCKATVVRAAHTGALAEGRTHVAITFDDAFRSVRTNAVPELLGRGFPATIFVPVDWVGRKPAWDMNAAVDDYVMSANELTSLPDGIELGSHGLSHLHLTKTAPAHLRGEIKESREKLSNLVGSPVSLLAFPYGEYDARIVDACWEAGYERVFAIEPRAADPAGQDFVRGRVAVSPTDGPLTFHLKSHGGYAWMTHASAVKRWMKSRRWFQ